MAVVTAVALEGVTTVAEQSVVVDNTGTLVQDINADTSANTIVNAKVQGLVNLATHAFSAYPLVPGTDVAHDTAAGVGALAANQGLQAGEIVKAGKVTGITIATTGVQTATVTFTTAFPTALDAVFVTLSDPSATAGISGVWTSGEATTGFTINVNVTTAAAAGSTIACYWIALGH
jgi:hypothetical protein